MHMGPVELSVSDLERTLEYWQRVVGLHVLARDGGRASLGVDRELVRFVEEPGAQPARGYAGLFHVALLLPERRDLARWLAHAAQSRVPLEGLSDHAVSEAIYLRDPDQHGIEIYADRPRELWEGRVFEQMTTLPLDVDSLFEELDGPRVELPEGTIVGHTHLCVSDVDAAVAFYTERLGMDVMAQLGSQAAFLSWEGYHHHIGVNSWESRGQPAAPPGTARLLSAAIVGDGVADGAATVHDPSGNTLRLLAAE
jgi:catechol 2,3-dioxygenase